MPTTETAKLYGHWLALWNGDLALADELVAPDAVIHHPALEANDREARRGAELLVAMVQAGRAPFAKLEFTLEVGPIEEDDKVAARWVAHGQYAGGLPGATAPAGTPVTFRGIDLFRVREGRIVEYWVSSDALQLMQQLGAVGNRT